MNPRTGTSDSAAPTMPRTRPAVPRLFAGVVVVTVIEVGLTELGREATLMGSGCAAKTRWLTALFFWLIVGHDLLEVSAANRPQLPQSGACHPVESPPDCSRDHRG